MAVHLTLGSKGGGGGGYIKFCDISIVAICERLSMFIST